MSSTPAAAADAKNDSASATEDHPNTKEESLRTSIDAAADDATEQQPTAAESAPSSPTLLPSAGTASSMVSLLAGEKKRPAPTVPNTEEEGDTTMTDGGDRKIADGAEATSEEESARKRQRLLSSSPKPVDVGGGLGMGEDASSSEQQQRQRQCHPVRMVSESLEVKRTGVGEGETALKEEEAERGGASSPVKDDGSETTAGSNTDGAEEDVVVSVVESSSATATDTKEEKKADDDDKKVGGPVTGTVEAEEAASSSSIPPRPVSATGEEVPATTNPNIVARLTPPSPSPPRRRWRSHQIAEDYIDLAGQMMYPAVHLGPFGYDPHRGQYPVERITTLSVLTSPMRRPSVVEMWSPYEIALFEGALSLYGKQFHTVSKVVRTKTTKEIVEFYYIWKKTGHYKKWKSTWEPEVESEEEDGGGGD